MSEFQQARVTAARDAIDRTFGWKHLRKYTNQPPEWFDKLRDGLARNSLAAADAVEAEYSEPCKASTHSWSHYRPEQIDSYWIRCKLIGPHEQHEDSDTGLKWEKTEDERTLPLQRTEAGWPNCASCEGGGCHDCTDPA